MNAKANNFNVKDSAGKNIPSRVMAPNWVYNIANGINCSSGTSLEENFQILKDLGGATLDICPYKSSGNVSNYKLFQDWHATDGVWRKANKYKVDTILKFKLNSRNEASNLSNDTIVTSPQDENISLIKKYLAYGNILPISLPMYGNYYMRKVNGYITDKVNADVIKKDENGNDVYLIASNTGEFDTSVVTMVYNGTSKYDSPKHSMTIVGYDDDMWIDINRDGIVQKSELGAFKLINSNGYDQGEWYAYDSLNKISAVPNYQSDSNNNALTATEKNMLNSRTNAFEYETYGIYVCKSNPSDTLVEFTLDSDFRSEVQVKLGYYNGSEKILDSYSTPCESWNKQILNYSGGDLPFGGKGGSTEGKFALDLKILEKKYNISLSDIEKFNITFFDKYANGHSLTVKDVNLVDSNGNIIKNINSEKLTYDCGQRGFDFTLDKE